MARRFMTKADELESPIGLKICLEAKFFFDKFEANIQHLKMKIILIMALEAQIANTKSLAIKNSR